TAAIAQAVDGDTISIASGIYTENLEITKDLTLVGADSTIIDGSSNTGVLDIAAEATVSIAHIIIQHGDKATKGVGIFNRGSVTIVESMITGTTTASRGRGSAPLEERTITGTTAVSSGSGIFNQGTLTLKNSTVSDNNANVAGGIYNDSAGTLI